MRKTILKTNRLKITTTQNSNIEPLYKLCFSDSEVVAFTPLDKLDLKETKAFIQKRFTYDEPVGFAPIFEKETSAMVGFGGILRFKYYAQENHYEIGYILGKAHWGKGYATEIAEGQIDKIKELFPTASIFATVHPDNLASHRVLEKLGMVRIEKDVKFAKRGLRDVYRLK